jgi:hypothetical protein
MADRDRPVANATSAMPPMAAARITLGDGRASTTNPARATAHTAADNHGPARQRWATNSTTRARSPRWLR